MVDEATDVDFEALLDSIDSFVIRLEMLRTAAAAYESGAFAERTSQSGKYRSAAFREDDPDTFVIEIETTDGESVGRGELEDAVIADLIAEHGDILGVRNEYQLTLASELSAISEDLHDGQSVSEAVHRVVVALCMIPGITAEDGLGSQGRVAFGVERENEEGTALFVPDKLRHLDTLQAE